MLDWDDDERSLKGPRPCDNSKPCEDEYVSCTQAMKQYYAEIKQKMYQQQVESHKEEITDDNEDENDHIEDPPVTEADNDEHENEDAERHNELIDNEMYKKFCYY